MVLAGILDQKGKRDRWNGWHHLNGVYGLGSSLVPMLIFCLGRLYHVMQEMALVLGRYTLEILRNVGYHDRKR